MAGKKALEASNKAFRESLEQQLSDLKRDFRGLGSSALWIGGGLLAAYLLTNGLSSKRKTKPKPSKKEKAKAKKAEAEKDSLLGAAVKEQLVIFLLGLAAQKLDAFIKKLESDEQKTRT